MVVQTDGKLAQSSESVSAGEALHQAHSNYTTLTMPQINN